MERLRRLDARIAQFEGWVATAVLLAMVLVASLQALFFNIAERGIAWATSMLEAMDWADTFLQKGTLSLAFLGASLATHDDKHIAIDVLTKIVSERAAAVMKMLAALGAGVVSIVLSRVFYDACIASDATVPFAYEVIVDSHAVHVCDAPASALIEGISRPTVLCALRGALAAIHVPVSSGAGIAQLIVPVMFVVIGIRLLARAIGIALSLGRGELPAAPGRAPEEKP